MEINHLYTVPELAEIKNKSDGRFLFALLCYGDIAPLPPPPPPPHLFI